VVVEEDVPVGVTVEREAQLLRIDWPSGPPSVIPWIRLRLACPCAQCQGEFKTQQLDPAVILQTAGETELVNVTIMGHYALQPEWKSGHATGIYPWEYLRTIPLPDVDRANAD
jgi:DUF971 family protein